MLFCSNKFQNFKNCVPFDDKNSTNSTVFKFFIDFTIIFEFADKIIWHRNEFCSYLEIFYFANSIQLQIQLMTCRSNFVHELMINSSNLKVLFLFDDESNAQIIKKNDYIKNFKSIIYRQTSKSIIIFFYSKRKLKIRFTKQLCLVENRH